jgi:pSer/pThr/pTyr-binding forkhead associated (FHA) protein
LLVTDLQSQNGTYVNESAITEPTLLKPGDTLQVGAILFQMPGQKSAPESMLPKSLDKLAEKPSGISDAEIASWLSDEFEKSPASPTDTTIIKNSAAAAEPVAAEPKAVALADTNSPAPAEAVRRAPRTVKEQAAEIIRRHWAEVRGGKPPAR